MVGPRIARISLVEVFGNGTSNYRRLRKAGRMNWFVEALKKYAVFSGRSRRKEY
jgi:hypothetical protein